MVNDKYFRGRDKERRLKRNLEKKGRICLRSAQSRGFADITAINREEKEIIFYQCKLNLKEKEKEKLEREFEWLNQDFRCSFRVI